MALSNQDLLKELSAKPIMEIVELVKMLEDTWGVSAAAPVAVAAAGGGAAAPAVEEQTEFTVLLNVMAQHLCQGTQVEEKRRAAGVIDTSCRREPRFRNTTGHPACVMVSIRSQAVT